MREQLVRDAATRACPTHWTPVQRLMFEAAPLLNRLGGLCSSIQRQTHAIEGRVPTSRRTLMIAQCEGRDYFEELGEKRASYVGELLEIAETLAEMGLKFKRLPEVKAWAVGDFSSLARRPLPGSRKTSAEV